MCTGPSNPTPTNPIWLKGVIMPESGNMSCKRNGKLSAPGPGPGAHGQLEARGLAGLRFVNAIAEEPSASLDDPFRFPDVAGGVEQPSIGRVDRALRDRGAQVVDRPRIQPVLDPQDTGSQVLGGVTR